MAGGAGEDRAELARTAFGIGRAAGDPGERLRWLDRAHRLLPADPTFALVLAQALLGRDNPAAEALLRPLVERHDVREAWLALAAARHGAGDPAGAADALAEALSRHAFLPQLAPLADAIAHAAGAPGWCGLAPDGALLTGPPGIAVQTRLAPDGRLHVTAGRVALLGSPLAPSLLIRTEGFVEHTDRGGLQGWAWLPSNPDRRPILTLRHAAGRDRRIVAEDAAGTTGGGLLARRRGFGLSAEQLRRLVPPLRVLGEDGRDLLGSPLPDARGGKPPPVPPRGRGLARPGKVAVIVPVHGGGKLVLDCLASVRATLPAFATLIVVEDGKPDASLARRLGALSDAGKLRLLRNPTEAGFPAAANAGISAALRAGCDVILLNSDTLVSGPWIADLRRVAYSVAEIGTVTPFSNSGGFLSYPHADRVNTLPDRAGTRRLAAAARAAAAGQAVEIPLGVGFCLYIRRDCVRETGLFRTGLFAQGYGEENDFCLRASALGWRHVAAPGVFVTHVGGASMGGAADDLRRRNSEMLERLHPGYHARIDACLRADPLVSHRRAIDLRRWHNRPASGPATAIVTHDQGGGVETAVMAQVKALSAAGGRAILLRPARLADGGAAVRVEEPRVEKPGTEFPNLKFALPAELPALLELLRKARVNRIAVHHLLGHAPAIRDLPRLLGVAHEVHVHDYAWICPRVVLLEACGRYCGEPDLRGCASCLARGGSFMDDITDAAALRRLSAGLLASAERVVVPSTDAANRIIRYFPCVRPTLAPHDAVARPVGVPASGAHDRIAVIGAIGPAKGYDVLLAIARDAAERGLNLSFVVVGHTTSDAALLATGHVFITGPFARDEAERLIRAQDAAMALIPSVVPETWCYALSDAWRAGLRVAAFDLGAQAERVRASGSGFILPLGCAPHLINDALLAACEAFRHEDEPQEA